MKSYNSLADLKEAPEAIRNYYNKIYEDTAISIDESFMDALGGDINLITSVEDLSHIYGDFDSAKNLSNTSFSFDQCAWEGDYVLIFTATNNAGGPSYWIPRSIAEDAPYVLESIRLTEDYWK
jgi:hypothetical protein